MKRGYQSQNVEHNLKGKFLQHRYTVDQQALPVGGVQFNLSTRLCMWTIWTSDDSVL